MLSYFDDEEIQEKNITIFTNQTQLDGPKKSVQISYSKLTTRMIIKNIEGKLYKTVKNIRIFNQEGVELFEDDLKFVKDKSVLFISDNGQDFNPEQSMKEYNIIKMLGSGGFGSVMLGIHYLTKEKRAIKIIDASKFGNAQDIDIVFREAEMLKIINHPNIVKFHHFFTLKNMKVAIIMDYLEGGELGHYVRCIKHLYHKKQKLNEPEAKQIFYQLADAINYCHVNNIIHRDLKLENILFEKEDFKNIKVVDFGIAGLKTNFNVDALDMGSLSYMPPELFLGTVKEIGPLIDVWALGIILYAMLCGILPFRGTTREKIRKSVLKDDIEFPPEQSLSQDCQNLILQLLGKDYRTRIKSQDITFHPWLAEVQKYKQIQKETQLQQNNMMFDIQIKKQSKVQTKKNPNQFRKSQKKIQIDFNIIRASSKYIKDSDYTAKSKIQLIREIDDDKNSLQKNTGRLLTIQDEECDYSQIKMNNHNNFKGAGSSFKQFKLPKSEKQIKNKIHAESPGINRQDSRLDDESNSSRGSICPIEQPSAQEKIFMSKFEYNNIELPCLSLDSQSQKKSQFSAKKIEVKYPQLNSNATRKVSQGSQNISPIQNRSPLQSNKNIKLGQQPKAKTNLLQQILRKQETVIQMRKIKIDRILESMKLEKESGKMQQRNRLVKELTKDKDNYRPNSRLDYFDRPDEYFFDNSQSYLNYAGMNQINSAYPQTPVLVLKKKQNVGSSNTIKVFESSEINQPITQKTSFTENKLTQHHQKSKLEHHYKYKLKRVRSNRQIKLNLSPEGTATSKTSVFLKKLQTNQNSISPQIPLTDRPTLNNNSKEKALLSVRIIQGKKKIKLKKTGESYALSNSLDQDKRGTKYSSSASRKKNTFLESFICQPRESLLKIENKFTTLYNLVLQEKSVEF